MRSLLIIWFFNAGELAVTSEIIVGPAMVCDRVLAISLAALNEHKTLRGMNRGAYGICVPLDAGTPRPGS